MADFAPTHPGVILLTEFLEPLGITQCRITKAIDVPARRINEILHGKRSVTADAALRLSRALGLSDMFSINGRDQVVASQLRAQVPGSTGRGTSADSTVLQRVQCGTANYLQSERPRPVDPDRSRSHQMFRNRTDGYIRVALRPRRPYTVGGGAVIGTEGGSRG